MNNSLSHSPLPSALPIAIHNPILIVDDDVDLLRSTKLALRIRNFHNVDTCSDPTQVLQILATKPYHLVFLDVWMPGLRGDALLVQIKNEYPDLTVIMVTANNDVDTAVHCIQAGAANYLVKPVEPTQLVAYIQQSLALHTLQQENLALKQQLPNPLQNPQAFAGIITANETMHLLFQYIEAVAITPHTIMITGESGTGKEMVAQAIHNCSNKPGNFVAVNVAGLDDTAIYSALFGHIKGAFTGAAQDRQGYIEKAANGTLFLDEIGDLSLDSQIKLLRLLQEHEYYPLGSDIPKKVTARFVVATHKDLTDPNQFREDLYYRLQTHHIKLPPLRERKSDIPLLANYIIEQYCQQAQINIPHIPPELYPLLATYSFPGNIRELQNILLDAVVQAKKGQLSLDPIRAYFTKRQKHANPAATNTTMPDSVFHLSNVADLPSLKQIQQALIQECLTRANGNQSIAAQMLGISRQALNKRLRTC
jgi:two-component system, NtrC family, nitrogen regulation response regulator GlnG